MNRLLSLAAVTCTALAIVFAAGPARAGQETSTLSVSATVLGSCTIDPATLAFGNYDPAATNALVVPATITVNCTAGSRFWVGLGLGQNTDGTDRFMTNGTDDLRYELRHTSGTGPIWNDADPGTDTLTEYLGGGLGNDTDTVTVYGVIPAGQDVQAIGAYSDTVQMTVNF
jgi:spore coat protein U-like protein